MLKKMCECGCGRETKIIKQTITSASRFKGDFNRYIYGHNNSSYHDPKENIRICQHCNMPYEKPLRYDWDQWLKSEYCSYYCSSRKSWTYKTDTEWAAKELLRAVENSFGCLEFQGPKNNQNYGQCYVFGKKDKAHRHIYRILIGEIPESMCVCHTCDNPSCINPEHLFIGTKQENNKDKIEKGRVVTRSIRKTPMDKQAISELKELALSGMTYPEIGAIFGIKCQRASIIAIANGIRRKPFVSKKTDGHITHKIG